MMPNTILPTLAEVNAAVVGILFTGLLAVFIAVYPMLRQLKDQLTGLRTETARIMTEQLYRAGSINYSEYVTDRGELDIKRIRRELLDISWRSTRRSPPDDLRTYLSQAGVDLPSPHEETKRLATHLLDLIYLLSMNYPYAGEGREYNDKWRDDLSSLNFYLTWYSETHKDRLLKLMNGYAKIYQEEGLAELQAEAERQRQVIRSTGGPEVTEAEVLEMLRPSFFLSSYFFWE